MAGELDDVSAFFVEAQPSAALLDEVVLDLEVESGADAGEGVAHDGENGAIAKSGGIGDVDGLEQRPHFIGGKDWGLAFLDGVLGSADRGGGVDGYDLAGDKPVE